MFLPCKFPPCIHADSHLRPCKFRPASMQIPPASMQIPPLNQCKFRTEFAWTRNGFCMDATLLAFVATFKDFLNFFLSSWIAFVLLMPKNILVCFFC